MPLLPLDLPPGIVRAGTEYASNGRWYDGNLTRWYQNGVIGPVGGWTAISTSAVTGSARSAIAWRADDNTRWVAIGTHSKLYAMNSSGVLFDITPVGFVSGRASAVVQLGYGTRLYGAFAYGTPRPDSGNYTDATVWDLDTFGQYLVGCSPDDGKIYQWTLSTATPAAALSGAPTSCTGVVVTPQGFIVALGAGANQRKLQWADQRSGTDWSPSATNQAGDFELAAGRIKCGRVVGDQTLILTDLNAHVMDYAGLPYVYSVRKVGDGCGAVSKRCLASTGQFGMWWGTGGFWLYDGAVRPIPCDVWDYLQANLFLAQRSKISSWHNAQFGEIWFEWPNGASENNAYVFWDYRKNVWGLSTSARSRFCGTEPGVYPNPLLMGSDGYMYQSEYGVSFGGDTAYMRSGPVELGNGDRVMEALGIVQDEATSGDANVSFRTRPYPNGSETTVAAASFDSSGYTDLRFSARQVEMVITGVAAASWRFGKPRLDLVAAGER